MTSMVDPKEMPNEQIPLSLPVRLQKGENVLQDAIVDSMQIPDIEAVVSSANVWLKIPWEQCTPCIIPKMGNPFA
jgi:hypothetical protein